MPKGNEGRVSIERSQNHTKIIQIIEGHMKPIHGGTFYMPSTLIACSQSSGHNTGMKLWNDKLGCFCICLVHVIGKVKMKGLELACSPSTPRVFMLGHTLLVNIIYLQCARWSHIHRVCTLHPPWYVRFRMVFDTDINYGIE
jgi:hypothetical protein